MLRVGVALERQKTRKKVPFSHYERKCELPPQREFHYSAHCNILMMLMGGGKCGGGGMGIIMGGVAGMMGW